MGPSKCEKQLGSTEVPSEKKVYRITATAGVKVAFSGQKSALFLGGDC